MTINKFPILFLLLAFSFIACSSDNDSGGLPNQQDDPMDDPQPTNLEAEDIFNVSYGTHAEQVYDIYLPENRTTATTKVLLLIHGGGWVEGDKADMNFFLPILQPQLADYAIVNMNYVLADDGEFAFPYQINDVGSVIEHVTQNASEYNINPSFGVIGLSAGAHLGLQYAYTQDTANAIKVACSVVGPVDFTDPYYTENPQFQFVETLVDENAYPPNTDFETLLSPALQVTSTSVPTILFYGESDPLVPQSQANAITDALEDASITHDLTIYEGGHGNWSFNSYLDLQTKLVEFINTHF